MSGSGLATPKMVTYQPNRNGGSTTSAMQIQTRCRGSGFSIFYFCGFFDKKTWRFFLVLAVVYIYELFSITPSFDIKLICMPYFPQFKFAHWLQYQTLEPAVLHRMILIHFILFYITMHPLHLVLLAFRVPTQTSWSGLLVIVVPPLIQLPIRFLSPQPADKSEHLSQLIHGDPRHWSKE